MKHKSHIDILKQGVDVWNKWMEDNHKRILDESLLANFKGKNLSGMNLSGAKFHKANFKKANLKDTKLREADLNGADLSEALLCNSDLRGAKIGQGVMIRGDYPGSRAIKSMVREPDLSAADFLNANLQGATIGGLLKETKFISADLREANLFHAILDNTVFANTDLTNVKGLNKCLHFGPSIIDHKTLNRSGVLPLEFLRGCGLPDPLIEYYQSLPIEPVQFSSCFISYSNKDNDFAKQLYADLQNKGVRCWFASEDMKIGERIRDAIEKSIRQRDKLLLVLSESSINSQWVEKEFETAFEEERKRNKAVLFPVRLDDAVMKTDQAWAADIRRTRHIGDFSDWRNHDFYQKSLERLLRDLKNED